MTIAQSVRSSSLTFALAAFAVAAGPANAQPASVAGYQVFTQDDFQSFVGNWRGGAPLCAAIRSQADWDRVMHPAPVMGRPSRPFAPPADFWRTHAGFLLARVAGDGGAPPASLSATDVRNSNGTLRIETRFTQTAPASYRIKTMILVVAPLPAPRNAVFHDADGTICVIGARARR